MSKDTDVLDMAEEQSDETFFIDSKEFAISDALNGIDAVLTRIEESGDFDIGANTLRSMYAAGRAIAHSTVKLCHGMHRLWTQAGRDPDQFWMWMQDVTPIKKITIERYINAWEAYLTLDDDRLLTRPIKDLVALGSTLAQGYEVDKSDVDSLIEATSPTEFAGQLRLIKGQEPRKSLLTIYLEPDGTLNAWNKDGVVNIGYINLSNESPIAVKAIERIVRCSGLIKR